jgi:hypothetical protein
MNVFDGKQGACFNPLKATGALLLAGLLCSMPVFSAEPSQSQPHDALVSVVVVGDIMLGGPPEQMMQRGQDPFKNFAQVFKAADLRLGNLECVVSDQGEPEPDKPNVFRVHPRAMRYLSRHFDAVGLANNHSGDYGPVAFADMLKRLRKAGVGIMVVETTSRKRTNRSLLKKKACASPCWASTNFNRAASRLTMTDRALLGVKMSRCCAILLGHAGLDALM